ncbi:U2 small nuclear ribonucleoprotein auxiliary factor-like protein [Wolffia australiana]
MTYVRPSLRLTWSGMRATDMEGWRAAMAEKKGYEQFEALFGEAVVAEIGFHRPFLFYARPLDPFRIDITVSDFCDHTFERVLTVQDVEDMRDETGIGSSCSEFLEYLISSLSSDDVRLIFEEI